ncbi:FecR family protein [Zhouia sp. PK063]|uniref:FecR family protein n=1 Tax=Zhouia sp. PK063 TaxID=3373602 RepID=UPI0037A85A90
MHTLLKKFIHHKLSEEEWKEFQQWITIPKNRAQAKKYLGTDYLINYSFQEGTDTSNDFLKLKFRLLPHLKKRNRYRVLKIITVCMLFIVSGVSILLLNLKPLSSHSAAKNTFPKGSNKAILTLEDGTEIKLHKNDNYQNTNAVNQQGVITYHKSTNKAFSSGINYLTIPLGGQYNLVLSDGTKVWLNSGSKIKYPIAFQPNHPRSIELLYGEAYFEVTSAKVNHDNSFEVKQRHQTVTVIGTKFNIKAYPDESSILTTVKEGKVAVEAYGKESFLLPNDQAIVSEDTTLERIKVNAQDEVAWIHGLFVFKSKSLKDIMRVLSRWYNVNITIKNKSLDTIQFKGTLSKNLPLEKILESIKSTGFINQYTIKNNHIYIN